MQVQLATSIETASTVVSVAPDSVELFGHPFAVLVGNGRLPELPEEAIKKLRDYLTYGGFFLSMTPVGWSDRLLTTRLETDVAALPPSHWYLCLRITPCIQLLLDRSACGPVATRLGWKA